MNPRNLKPAEALELLEMPQDTLVHIRDQKSLEVFKEKIKKQRKILAKKYHPDKFPSQHIMQNINAICDLLLKVQIIHRPQFQVVRVRTYTYTSSSTTGTAWS
jgi:hypothetical protein